MYTSTAAQHLLSQSSLVAAHLLPHSSLKVFASKSSCVIPATLTKPRLPGNNNNALAFTTAASVSQLFSPSPSHSRRQGARWKNNLPASHALGYNEAEDVNIDDDDVYVKSFRQTRGSPPLRDAPAERSSSRMADRRRYNDGVDSNSRSPSGKGAHTRVSTSTQRDRSGFLLGFKDERDGSQEAIRGGRGTLPRPERVDGENFVASSTTTTRRNETLTGSRASRAPRTSRSKQGLVLDEATGEMVEYRHPDWKEDPKAARKAKREPAVAPQVHFETPMRKQPHVAILGGGMSGLVCALTLEELGIRSTVFDTGKHGLGGRMATRDIHLRDGLSLAFDHAAQYFTVSDPKFRKLVNRWINEGAVKEWKGVVGTLRAGGTYSGLADDVPRYVGMHGMRPLADHMVSQGRLIEVKRPVWISNMDAKGALWHLNENGKPHGEYDAVVIAHNGKCANRLLAPSGAPEVFKQMKRLELSSIWALMAAFEEALPLPEGLGSSRLDGAFIEGVNSVSWMANNSSKLDNAEKDAPHCWTFFSTAAYGKKNKVPQESIPAVKAERVRREMLQGVGVALGLPEGSMPTPFFTKVQLWGAGLPTNTPGVPCIFDPVARVGICGDWLLGSSLEAAALSGMALAEHIADFRDRGEENPEEFSIGLRKGFSQVQGKDIGQFPGSSALEPKAPQELVGSAH